MEQILRASSGDGAFTIKGRVDGHVVEAELRDGVLLVDEALLRRAEVVTALGDTFELDGEVRHTASVGVHWAATLLTLMRGMDEIVDVAFTMPVSPTSDGTGQMRRSTSSERDDFRRAVRASRNDTADSS